MASHFCFAWLQSNKLQSVTGYRASELKDCITAIHDLQLSRKGQSWNAIRDKYKQHRVSMHQQSHFTYDHSHGSAVGLTVQSYLEQFKGVSALLPPVGIPASYFEDLKE